MKRFIETTILATAGLLLVSQPAQAAYNANDLILGFNLGAGSGPNDYIIDLGNANTAVGVGGSVAINLSGLYSSSTFNGLYGSLSSGVSMSVVGGNGATAGRDLYMTALRTSNFGVPSLAGSSAPGSLSSTFMASGVNDVGNLVNVLGLTPGGSATVQQGDPGSFFNNVLSAQSPSFLADTGRNPSGSIASGSILYEDLYRGTPSGAFSYLGYFSLNTSGTPSLTFTPVAVPEPTAFALIAGFGLFFFVRRQLKPNLV